MLRKPSVKTIADQKYANPSSQVIKLYQLALKNIKGHQKSPDISHYTVLRKDLQKIIISLYNDLFGSTTINDLTSIIISC